MAGECLLQIGRRLQTTYVVGGTIKDFRPKFALKVEVYESRTGRSIESLVLRDLGLESMGEQVEVQAADLMSRVTGGPPGTAGVTFPLSTTFLPPPDIGTAPVAAPVRKVQALALEFGKLTVEGSPKGARVDVTGPAGFEDKGQLVPVDPLLSHGTIQVTGTPEGARVKLSCTRGFSDVFGLPDTLSVPQGRCLVQVTRNGWQRFDRSVEVAE